MLTLDKVVRIGKLFGFYGSLLTARQQEFVKLYYYHDLSLGEIAEQYDISRQAVYDNLKRSEEVLKESEEKLGFVNYYQGVQKQIDKLEEIIDKVDCKLAPKELEGLLEILDQLKIYQEGELN